MLRLKKKNEEKANEVSDVKESKDDNQSKEVDMTNDDNSNTNNGSEIKLLGIGGKASRTADGAKKTGKKRTPGEIRIQKDISELDGGQVAQVSFPNPTEYDCISFTDRAAGVYKATSVKDNMDPTQPRDGELLPALLCIAHEL